MVHLSQTELARRARVSASYISYLEHGKKVPTLSVALALADAFGLEAQERDKLLHAGGFKPRLDMGTVDVLAPIHDFFQDPRTTGNERDELAAALREYLVQWKNLREERKKGVRKAAVVAAGWQPRLLSPHSLEKTLIHAAHEVVKAGIEQLIAVVAPETPDSTFGILRGRFDLVVNRVVQEEPLGLGDAVLVAKDQVGTEPFAVILPDDIDPSGKTLKMMVDLYETTRRPLVAVNPGPLEPQQLETRYYGIAFLSEKLSDAGLRRVEGVSEKPRQLTELPCNSRVIVGRYILTAEIFDKLQNLEPNKLTRRLELTDALAVMLRSEVLFAYELKDKLLPLAPVRSVIEKLIDSIRDRRKYERVLDLTAELLQAMDKI
jgi:UTP-glucose-1-phosphate uridylyltransferase/DNA-binding XRE family transcriptional regulator